MRGYKGTGASGVGTAELAWVAVWAMAARRRKSSGAMTSSEICSSGRSRLENQLRIYDDDT